MDIENLAVHAESLRALARRLVRDAAAADDVVQEACLAALRRRPAPGTRLRPWLAGVVRNLSLRRRREEARRSFRESCAARPEGVAPPDEAVERAELRRLLLDEILGLDEPYRTTLLLRHVEGLSHAATARRLGVPAGTVSARLHRGLEILRGRLDRRFGGRVAWCLLFLALVPRPSVAAWGAVAVSTKKTLTLALVLLLALGGLVGTFFLERGKPSSVRSQRDAAARPDLASAPEDAPSPSAVIADPVDRDLDLHGVVVDAAGAPVPGARVQSFWYPWQRGGLGTGDLLYEEVLGPGALADADGSFALRLGRGQQVNLRASASGFATSEFSGLQAGERVRVVLGAGVRVVLECVDQDAKAVAGAWLRLYRHESGSFDHNFVERRGETGADGRCVLDGLPAGEWGYLAVGHGRLAGVWRPVPFPASGPSIVRIVLPAGRTLYGTVRDVDTGAPIPGARVGESFLMRYAVTDGQGRYELRGWGLDGGIVDLDAAADGYARQSTLVGPDDRLDFVLRRAGELRGRVVGADGAPVAAALLRVRGRDESMYFATLVHGTSSADGTFLLHGIARGTANTLTVAAPGHGRYMVDFAAPGNVDLGDVRLPAARTIEGRVLLADGTTAPGIVVVLEGGNADRDRLSPGAEPGLRTGAGREERRSDDLGRFRFSDLAPGAYTLTCGTPGYKPVPLDVTVPEDGDATGLELHLPGGHDLTVRLTDTAGRPAWNVTVFGQLADQWSLQGMSDATGVVRFHADSPFESVSLSDFQRGRYRLPPARLVPPGAKEVALVLELAGIASGIVLDPDGRLLPQAVLRVLSNGEPVEQGGGDAFSDLEGKFRVVVPMHGTADILLTGATTGAKFTSFTGRLVGVASGAKDLVLQARPLSFDRAISARVLAPDGSALRGAQVYARLALTGELVRGANVLTDETGAARLAGLPDTEIGVWARAVPGHRGAEDWMDASAFPVLPEGQVVTLRLRHGLRVRGRVLSGEDPAAEAHIYAYNGNDLIQTTQADADGSFSMLVPADQNMPLRLVGMKWEGRVLSQGQIEEWEPPDGEAVVRLEVKR